jgi:hypothetical protein
LKFSDTTDNLQNSQESWPRYCLFGQTFASDYPFGVRLMPSDDAIDFFFTCSSEKPSFGEENLTEPTYTSPYRNQDGESILTFYNLEGYQIMHYPDIADYYLRNQSIYCHLLNPINHELAALHILPAVVSTWMELRQAVVALHASAVVVEGATITFLAHSGQGKSTLAATFVKAGYPLLTDDILLIEESDGDFQTKPGYPSMRLWPDEAVYFRGQYEDLELIQSGYDKRRVPLSDQNSKGFWDHATQLGCIYLPQRRQADDEQTDVRIEPVSKQEAVIELIRFAYTTRLSRALGRDAQRLSFFSRIAANIPIRKLSYPSGYECLPKVFSAVLEDL